MKKNVLFLFVLSFLISAASLFAEEISQPNGYKLDSDILYRSTELAEKDEYIKQRCRLDVYYPENRKGFATIVWFHGGGLEGGERYIPQEFKEKNLAVVPVNYRLSPKVKSPAFIDDAAAATAWVMKNIEKYGGDPDLIFVSGHSAGGYLTSMIGMDKSWLAKYDVDADKIAGLIPFSGHTITHFTVRKERGIPGTQPIIDALAPLYHVRDNAPPLILITGDRNLEMLGRYEENAYMYRMMKVVGHKNTQIYELDGFDHGGMVSPACSIALKFIDRTVQNAKKH